MSGNFAEARHKLSGIRGQRSLRRPLLALALGSLALVTALFASTGDASAALTLLKPSLTDSATFFGRGGYSADGLGQNGTGGTVQAEVPAGSTVVRAYLYGTYISAAPSLADRTINFDGTNVVLTQIGAVGGLSTARAEVTAQVATKVGGGGGITNFAINNDPLSLNGVALVVIYSNPASPETTIAVLDGAASQSGDTATFTFAGPLDKTVPGFSAIMTVGSGHSYQGVAGHACGGGQFSTIAINAQPLADCSGNFDDGLGNNGALITVGGVGDSTANPTLPLGADDELYDLAPFLKQGDTGVTITTSNPSQDDDLFLAVIAITARAAVTTEICTDGIDNDNDGLIDLADPDCAPAPPANGPDLTVTKELKPGQPAAAAGGRLYYLVRVKNEGNKPTPAPPNTVTMIDTPPTGTTIAAWSIISGSGSCSLNGAGELVCGLGGNMAPGAETVVEVVIRTPTSGRLVNTATVDPFKRITESNENNNTATLPTVIP